MEMTVAPEQLFHSNFSFTGGNQIYLERPHLYRLFERAIDTQVVTVTAGAGYGKTQAVYSFLNKKRVITCWIQFSQRDNISARFWENFTGAVGMINAESTEKLLKYGFPETERQFERYMAVPVADLVPAEKYIFVYDDFHLLKDELVLRFMERSVTAPFHNITSILISRTEPPFDLSKLEARGKLAKITEEDLLFSQDETAEYFRMLGLKPSPQVISEVHRDTKGWAFAIYLAGLSMKNAPAAGYIPQALRFNIFKLIESEIMAFIAPEPAKFLIKLSLVDILAPELVRKIAGMPQNEKNGDDDLFSGIAEAGSFIQYDEYLKAYKIHPLFLEYLSGRQDELSAEEKKDVWEMTAAWCETHGQKMDAINCCEKAGDYSKMIELIYTLSINISNKTAKVLLDIMERLPQWVYEEYILVNLSRTRLLCILGKLKESAEELWPLIHKYEARPITPATRRFIGDCYISLGFVGKLLFPFSGNYDWIGYFKTGYYYRSGIDHVLKNSLMTIPLGAYACRVGKNGGAGDIEQYIKAVAETVPYVSGAMSGATSGLDDLVRAEVAYFRGDLRKSEEYAVKTINTAREAKQYEIENRALFFLVRIYLARGKYDGIRNVLGQLDERTRTTEFPGRYILYDIVTGWLYAQTGQQEKIPGWLRNDFEESDLNSLQYGLEMLVKVKYHLLEKRYPAALAVLETREESRDVGIFLLGQIEIKALEAVCRYRNRDRSGAYSALEEAYTLAYTNALYMPFIELGKDMRTLAGAALKEEKTGRIPENWLERVRRNASAYAKKLYSAAGQFRSSEKKPGALTALSTREIEVLDGLSRGLTREEIANSLSISVNTVKSVIRSIYNKLGAVNRADAVRIAAQSGKV
jgi:LuxR family maltose regulon positive regulatory protein